MEQLERRSRIGCLNLGFQSDELIITQVLAVVQCALRCKFTLVDLLREFEEECPATVRLIARHKVLVDDLRRQLIGVGQVARLLSAPTVGLGFLGWLGRVGGVRVTMVFRDFLQCLVGFAELALPGQVLEGKRVFLS